MSRSTEYDDLDFSDDRHTGRSKRRRSKVERHRARQKPSYEFEDNYIDDDDYDLYDDWNDDPIEQYRSHDNNY